MLLFLLKMFSDAPFKRKDTLSIAYPIEVVVENV